jgi:signal transduction histidine kinase
MRAGRYHALRDVPAPLPFGAPDRRDIRQAQRTGVTAEEPLDANASIRVLAHDVRSPLQTIQLCCDLLAAGREGVDPPAAALVTVIRDALAQISGVIDDVLDPGFTGGPADEPTRTAVATALLESLDRHSSLAALNGVVLEAGTLAAGVAAIEKSRLLRVMANLLTNAIRFTPPGGRIRVSAEPVGEDVWIFVADTGIGIPEDRLPTLFQGSDTAQQGAGGYGLRIVRRIVESVGGRVAVVSSEGSGSTFTVIIPRSRGAASPRADISSGSRARPAGAVRNADEAACAE